MPSGKPRFGSPIMGSGGKPGLAALPKTVNLTIDGNSLSALPGNYTNELLPLLRPGYAVTMRNYGISGQRTTAMNANAATKIDVPYHKNLSYNIIFVLEGTNHLGAASGATAQQAYDELRTYCLGRKAYGLKVIIGTITPSSNAASGNLAVFEAARSLVNTKIRTNWYDFADGIADIGGHEVMGVPGASTDLAYYNDGTHLTPAGNTILAGVVSKAINLLLPP